MITLDVDSPIFLPKSSYIRLWKKYRSNKTNYAHKDLLCVRPKTFRMKQNAYVKVSNFIFGFQQFMAVVCNNIHTISYGKANFFFDRSNFVCTFPFQMMLAIAEIVMKY